MRKTKVLLVGGFHKARALALSLVQKGYKITAINRSYEDCEKLADIKALNVIHGDGTKPYVLEEAGAEDADIVIALTQRDEDNLVICELCKQKYGSMKTVALLNDPKKTDFFYKMGIDSVVCAINAITGIIEQQAFMDEMATRVPIAEGRVSISEVYISEGAAAAGKKLWEINTPKDTIIGCILRGEQSMIPQGDTRILTGDTLVVISANGQEQQMIEELTRR